MRDYDAIVAQILVLLQQETGEQGGGDIAEVPGEGIFRKYPYKARCMFITDRV
jgi:hypothetical protein